MKQKFPPLLIGIFLACIFSCNNRNQQQTTANGDTQKYLFETGKLGVLKTVKEMRQLHLDYCDYPLPLYSKEDPSLKVRYMEVPLSDIQAIEKALGDNFGGFRIYLGYDVNSKAYHFILAGIDGSNKKNHLKDNEIADDFNPCPKTCFAPDGDETDLNYFLNAQGKPEYKQPK